MIDLHVEVYGTANAGPAVVLSHGMAEDMATWTGVAQALCESRRVVLWDLPGHGQSAELADPSGYTARLAYERLCEVIETHGGERLVIGGHSLGGYLSCRYAIEHPETVAGLILVSTGPGFRDDAARERWNDDVRATVERTSRPSSFLALHEDAFVISHVAELTMPVLVLVGANDKPFLAATDYFERKLPAVERHTIDGAGHSVIRTNTGQVAALISAFLQRV